MQLSPAIIAALDKKGISQNTAIKFGVYRYDDQWMAYPSEKGQRPRLMRYAGTGDKYFWCWKTKHLPKSKLFNAAAAALPGDVLTRSNGDSTTMFLDQMGIPAVSTFGEGQGIDDLIALAIQHGKRVIEQFPDCDDTGVSKAYELHQKATAAGLKVRTYDLRLYLINSWGKDPSEIKKGYDLRDLGQGVDCDPAWFNAEIDKIRELYPLDFADYAAILVKPEQPGKGGKKSAKEQQKPTRSDDNFAKVKAAVDVVAVVNKFVPLTKKGRLHVACCPFHAEDTPSFKVDPDNGWINCYGSCGQAWDVFSFIEQHQGVSPYEALCIVADFAGVDVRTAPDLQAADLSAAPIVHGVIDDPAGDTLKEHVPYASIDRNPMQAPQPHASAAGQPFVDTQKSTKINNFSTSGGVSKKGYGDRLINAIMLAADKTPRQWQNNLLTLLRLTDVLLNNGFQPGQHVTAGEVVKVASDYPGLGRDTVYRTLDRVITVSHIRKPIELGFTPISCEYQTRRVTDPQKVYVIPSPANIAYLMGITDQGDPLPSAALESNQAYRAYGLVLPGHYAYQVEHNHVLPEQVTSRETSRKTPLTPLAKMIAGLKKNSRGQVVPAMATSTISRANTLLKEAGLLDWIPGEKRQDIDLEDVRDQAYRETRKREAKAAGATAYLEITSTTPTGERQPVLSKGLEWAWNETRQNWQPARDEQGKAIRKTPTNRYPLTIGDDTLINLIKANTVYEPHDRDKLNGYCPLNFTIVTKTANSYWFPDLAQSAVIPIAQRIAAANLDMRGAAD